MILSFGSDSVNASAAALALGIPSSIALLAYAICAALGGQRAAPVQRGAMLVGWIAQGLAIVVDSAGFFSASSGARFGFATALSATSWLVVAVYGIESRFLPMRGVQGTLAVFGLVSVALAWVFPAELRSVSRWAPVHWILGIASYGLFGAAVLHAAMLGRVERQLRGKALRGNGDGMPAHAAGVPLLSLERLTFRFVAAGFFVLSAALLLGVWFASPWRWDHKTVFSILGWAVFAALLAGRRVFGWRGPLATRWLYAGAGLLLLAYVGSRFVLEVLLHRLPAN
ncbi:MAG: cytochrome c biogenesis protein CcsA [Burkholderiaceae bacterium]